MSRLSASISRLYEVFRPYRRGETIEGCPCCVPDEARAALHRVPLRELEWADLQTYSAKALTTFGGLRDFKHFLPRILELSAQLPGDAPFPLEIILGKLAYGNWREWPEREVAALGEYVNAIRATLSESEGEVVWDDWDRDELRAGLAAVERGAD